MISRGYSVQIEKNISEILVCDIFAKKGGAISLLKSKRDLLLLNMLWTLLIIMLHE